MKGCTDNNARISQQDKSRMRCDQKVVSYGREMQDTVEPELKAMIHVDEHTGRTSLKPYTYQNARAHHQKPSSLSDSQLFILDQVCACQWSV